MKFRSQTSLIVVFAAAVVILLANACGSGGGNNKVAKAMQSYQAKPASTHLKGTIEGVDELHFVLFNDRQTDTMVVFSVANGLIDVILEKIPANEVYFLEIRGRAEGYEDQGVYWREVVPIYAQDGSELELVAETEDERNTLSKRKFTVRGGGEEQELLQSWFRKYTLKQDELDDQITLELSSSGQMRQRNNGLNPKTELAVIDQSFIDQAKPLATTLFLISRQNNHRTKSAEYLSLLENVSSEVLQGKYGIDLNNRLVRITQFSKQLDFEKVLAARDAKLANFDAKAYSDKEYILLAFWASRYPQASEQLPEVGKLISNSEWGGKFALVHISLDQKMSAWKSASEKLALPESYMLRAEVRQTAIEELYLTDLPRYMVIKSDGTVVENDIPYEELENVLKSL